VVSKPVHSILQVAIQCRYQALVKTLIDVTLIMLAAGWAWLVSFGQLPSPGAVWPFLLVVVCARLIIYFVLGLQHSSWVHVSRFEVRALALSAVLGVPLIAGLSWALPDPFPDTLARLVRPGILLTTEPAFYLLLLFAARITVRALEASQEQKNLRRILVIGVGHAALSLAFQIQESRSGYHIVGFLDDAHKQKRWLRGLPVLGARADLKAVVEKHDVQEIVIAVPSLTPEELRETLKSCESTGLAVRILPPLKEMIGGTPSLQALREVQMEDLLPRPEVQLDRAAISSYMKGRCVLVTGGGGSIGGELCRQALDAGAARLVVLGRGENSVFEITQELAEINQDKRPIDDQADDAQCEVVPVICDVRDRVALRQIFAEFRPHVVFHAAAHKHVPLMEQHPCEAVKNNVLGTLNAVQLATESGVERFVLVSTDKAVNPCNVMGATKRICEMIVKGHAGLGGTRMVSVRFGNVLGSRGSVVPTMTRQIRQGRPITVTDPDMVRYFMTIPEASQLILQAGAVGGNGDVFILEMGHPVRILDLAHDLIRLSGLVPNQDIPINIIGARPGEKMEEELLTSQEHQGAQKQGPFFVAPPQEVALQSLLAKIEELKIACERDSGEAVRRILPQIIPDFKPENGINHSTEITSGQRAASNGSNPTPPAKAPTNGASSLDLKFNQFALKSPEETPEQRREPASRESNNRESNNRVVATGNPVE